MYALRYCAAVTALLASFSATAQNGPKPRYATVTQTGVTQCSDVNGASIACAGTGQDGDVQFGAPALFVDNQNGTITDSGSGLTWEKKSRDGSFNDFLRAYTYDEAISVHVATLNAQAFGGHTDWRLPNAREVMLLTNFAGVSPAVFPEFNTPGCQSGAFLTVLTGNCTPFGGSRYWSSTPAGGSAFTLLLEDGRLLTWPKSFQAFVRAVRGPDRKGGGKD